MKNLLKSYKELQKILSGVIDYDLLSYPTNIIDMTGKNYTVLSDDWLGFDRNKFGDMYDHPYYRISSLHLNCDKYHRGEIDEYEIFLAYEQNGMSDAEVLIFNKKNRWSGINKP